MSIDFNIDIRCAICGNDMEICCGRGSFEYHVECNTCIKAHEQKIKDMEEGWDKAIERVEELEKFIDEYVCDENGKDVKII